MALLDMPVRSDLPSYEFRVPLERVNYVFRFRFNVRMDRWIMSVADEEGDPIIAGVPVLTDIALLRQYPLTTLPPGILFPMDTQGFDENPSVLALLGDRVKLIYSESEAA